MTVQTQQSLSSKEAMMKILSGLMRKSVQEKYRAGGKGKNDNKASFKDTFIYATMRGRFLYLTFLVTYIFINLFFP